MTADTLDRPLSRPLETIFKEHLDNTIECGNVLSELFLNLEEPDQYIAKVKQLEEKGDKLTAEAYGGLELLTYSEYIHITEQLVKRLDDIVDGINNTARLIDICHPRQIENAAQEILSALMSMIETLQSQVARYPDIDLASMRACCKALKTNEENADLIYHEWRKKQRRVLVLSLIEESNWTEILGVLEQTTDAAYHAGLLLERTARYRQK
ncbi:DUF47 domain-containing protein [Methylomonas rivi]|uniref:DUF47 family protein n=1 Tax=Methylomonas rivi TaxID=2952226 RepID=A0ABT1U3Q8_9GAMM|nr:DUF47 family protein [Methylomonas sp. WSC-6]MBS4050949.1 DUF47 family protein [Methylomonas sp.]MCQ8128467.1 DUF47 family protein [Methylomonas sp. WSC-6]